MPKDKNNVPFYQEHGFPVMENGQQTAEQNKITLPDSCMCNGDETQKLWKPLLT